jgi:hypothetical protein
MHMAETPIVRLLLSEAEAWRALLALKSQSAHLCTQIGCPDESLGTIAFNESVEVAAQRESTYIAALSQLAASLDNAQAEVIKLRGLRKAKHSVESSAFRQVLQAHSDEVLAVGESMARSASLDMASTAASLRQASFRLKTCARDANALLAALSSCIDLPLKDGETVVIGLAKEGTVINWATASDLCLEESIDKVISSIRETAKPLPTSPNNPSLNARGRSFTRRVAPS